METNTECWMLHWNLNGYETEYFQSRTSKILYELDRLISIDTTLGIIFGLENLIYSRVLLASGHDFIRITKLSM